MGTNRLRRRACWLAPLALALLACSDGERARSAAADPRAAAPETVWVEIGAELFELELAIDPRVRFRGLGGRRHIPRNGGMLFVNPEVQPQAMVMRDCPIPIDVAFLDEGGRVVAMHTMQPEPGRRSGESAADYEARLPVYPSGEPAAFAVETASGRLEDLGVQLGDAFVFDTQGLRKRVGRGR